MNRIFKLTTVVLIGLAVVLALYLIFGSPDSTAPAPISRAEKQNSPVSGSVGHPANAEYPSRLVASGSADVPEQRPASLEGTSVPGGWDRTDANGSLVPTPELRHLFEYYLAALGEETLAQLIARIQNALAVLQEPARSEAMDILGAYLDYKLELGELEAGTADASALSPDAMARQLADIRALRRRWLDADTAEAFFAMEEAIDEFQLAQRRIRADESLSDEARAQRLQEAEQSLPPPIREARQQTRRFSEYQQLRQQLSDDPKALQAWRVQAFGSEAAARLAQVEAEQNDWDQRWQDYQQEKAELGRLGLAGPEREAAIERLRQQYFDGPEIYRAEALDSVQ